MPIAVLTDFFGVAGEHAKDAFRNARSHGQLCQCKSSEGCCIGRLENHLQPTQDPDQFGSTFGTLAQMASFASAKAVQKQILKPTHDPDDHCY